MDLVTMEITKIGINQPSVTLETLYLRLLTKQAELKNSPPTATTIVQQKKKYKLSKSCKFTTKTKDSN
jgi:hypothetical protein